MSVFRIFKKTPGAMYAAIGAFLVNAVNAALNGLFGWMYGSDWMFALAAYYGALAFARGGIIFRSLKLIADGSLCERERNLKRLSIYRFAGIFLLIITLILTALIALIVRDGNSFEQVGYAIYYFAVYTVYKLVMAIRSAVKARSDDDFSVRAIRNTGLADAAVSVLSLQTALFAAFGEGADVRWANAATGAVVCAFIIYLSVFMIVQSVIARRKFRPKRRKR